MSLLFVTENLLDLDEDTMHWSESCGFSEDGFSQQPTTNFTQKPYALTQYESLNQTGELQDLLKRSEKHELSKNSCIFFRGCVRFAVLHTSDRTTTASIR